MFSILGVNIEKHIKMWYLYFLIRWQTFIKTLRSIPRKGFKPELIPIINILITSHGIS